MLHIIKEFWNRHVATCHLVRVKTDATAHDCFYSFCSIVLHGDAIVALAHRLSSRHLCAGPKRAAD